jgi:hypothetical protein
MVRLKVVVVNIVGKGLHIFIGLHIFLASLAFLLLHFTESRAFILLRERVGRERVMAGLISE